MADKLIFLESKCSTYKMPVMLQVRVSDVNEIVGSFRKTGSVAPVGGDGKADETEIKGKLLVRKYKFCPVCKAPALAICPKCNTIQCCAERKGQRVTCVNCGESYSVGGGKRSQDPSYELEIAPTKDNVSVYLLMDCSGSMRTDDAIDKAKTAIMKLVDKFDEKISEFAVISFSDKVNFVRGFTEKHRLVERAIKSIQPGGGNLGNPINAIKKLFESSFEDQPEFKPHNSVVIVVLLTDGKWVNADVNVRAGGVLAKNGVKIYGIGFGEADMKFLRQIAVNENVESVLDKLGESFSLIASSILQKK